LHDVPYGGSNAPAAAAKRAPITLVRHIVAGL
jgi:hypothetical protein